MIVLWITGSPFSHHWELLGLENRIEQSGSWLSAAFNQIKTVQGIELYLATFSNVDHYLENQYENCHFCILPLGNRRLISDSVLIHELKKLKKRISPDLVQIWGTESKYSLPSAVAFESTPIILYMQGVMGSIREHYYDGVPWYYSVSTIRDIYNRIHYARQVRRERNLLMRTTAVVVENDWCEDHCKAINPAVRIFKSYVPMREEFYFGKWSLDKVKRHTLFTNAGGYPIKGHHILFKALSIVQKHYPDVMLYIPGVSISEYSSFKRRTGYIRLLKHLIKRYRLQDNIQYVGVLSTQGMIDYLERSNLFVMPSIVENHSNSLIEALLVGVPSVASFTGGVIGYAIHKENTLLYNSLDAESLAGNIIRVLRDDNLAEQLSRDSLIIREKRPKDFGKDIIRIYQQVYDEYQN